MKRGLKAADLSLSFLQVSLVSMKRGLKVQFRFQSQDFGWGSLDEKRIESTISFLTMEEFSGGSRWKEDWKLILGYPDLPPPEFSLDEKRIERNLLLSQCSSIDRISLDEKRIERICYLPQKWPILAPSRWKEDWKFFPWLTRIFRPQSVSRWKEDWKGL
jgi:hypothetical protein